MTETAEELSDTIYYPVADPIFTRKNRKVLGGILELIGAGGVVTSSVIAARSSLYVAFTSVPNHFANPDLSGNSISLAETLSYDINALGSVCVTNPCLTAVTAASIAMLMAGTFVSGASPNHVINN